jgi:hypothetical protein
MEFTNFNQIHKVIAAHQDLAPDVRDFVLRNNFSIWNENKATHFLPGNHNFLHTTKTVKPELDTSMVKDACRVQHNKKDIHDDLYLSLFSQAHLHLPKSMFEKERKQRTRQENTYFDILMNMLPVPLTTRKATNARTQSKRQDPTSVSTDRIHQILVENQVLFNKRKTPSFEGLFPGTTRPQTRLLHGQPVIASRVFQSLIVSVFRKAKTALRKVGISLQRLPDQIARSISSMINRSLTKAKDVSVGIKKIKLSHFRRGGSFWQKFAANESSADASSSSENESAPLTGLLVGNPTRPVRAVASGTPLDGHVCTLIKESLTPKPGFDVICSGNRLYFDAPDQECLRSMAALCSHSYFFCKNPRPDVALVGPIMVRESTRLPGYYKEGLVFEFVSRVSRGPPVTLEFDSSSISSVLANYWRCNLAESPEVILSPSLQM